MVKYSNSDKVYSIKEDAILDLFLISAAVVIRIFSSSLANVYQKKLAMSGCHPISVIAITYTVLSLVGLVPIIALGITPLNTGFWTCAVLVGFLGAIGNGFLVKSFEKGDLSILAPINAYKSVVGLLFAALVLGEYPNLYGLLGMILIIWGSYFVLDTLEERFSLRLFLNRQIQYRIISLVFCAIEAVFIKKLIELSSVLEAFVAWCVCGAIFSLLSMRLLGLSFTKEFSALKTRNAIMFVNVVVCIGMMQYMTNYVFTRIDVAYALSLFQLGAVVSVILGFSVFQERNILRKLLGTTIMICGAVVIILFNS